MPREIHIWNVRLVEVAWENLEGRKRCRFDVGLSLGGLSSLGGLERSDSQVAIRHPAGVTNVIDAPDGVTDERTDGHSRRNRDFGSGRLRLPSIPRPSATRFLSRRRRRETRFADRHRRRRIVKFLPLFPRTC